MSKLFNPAIYLMNRLKYPQKFGLISLLFALPLLLTILLLLPEIEPWINFAQKELVGVKYLYPLRTLLEHLPQARELNYAVANASGTTTFKEDLLSKQRQLEQDFKVLEQLEQESGSQLSTAPQFANLKVTWLDLKGRDPTLEIDATDKLYVQLVAQLRDLISQVGDSSNLILDPELESYYLMDAVLLKLPQAQDLLGQANLSLEKIIAGKILSPEEKEQLSNLTSQLQLNNEATRKGLQIALNNDPNQELKTRLGPTLLASSASTQEFLSAFEKIVAARGQFDLQPSQYRALATKALNSKFELWDKTINELRQTLQRRLDRLTHKKALFEFSTFGIILVVAYLLTGFYLAVMRTVSCLAEASNRMAGGEINRVKLENHDELGQVVISFNQVAGALVSTSLALHQRQQISEDVSVQVLGLSTNLRATVSQQASATHQQVAIISQINTTLDELTSEATDINQLADKVNDISSVVAKDSQRIVETTRLSVGQSEKGVEAVERTVAESEEVGELYQQLLKTLAGLKKGSARMRQVVDIITGLAGETHLIALNAALEAAGAGEYGERFGVVAQEVKNLSLSSRNASLEVLETIQIFEEALAQAALSAQSGYEKTCQMQAVAQQAGIVITEMSQVVEQAHHQALTIGQAAQEARELSGIIKTATGQQQLAHRQVLEALGDLRVVAQQNALGSNLVSVAATRLEEASHNLNLVLVA